MRQKHLATYPSSLSMLRRLGLGATLLALLTSAALPTWADAVPTATHTTLESSIAGNGKDTSLVATVTTATGDTVDTGTVDFLLPNGQSLGSAQVDSNGSATLLLSSLPAATRSTLNGDAALSLVAAYHAPATETASDYSDSHSPATAVVTPQATTATPSFTVTGNPTTLSVKAGSYGTTILTVTSVSGYAGSIEFSCSKLPAQTTCAFNPTQQNLNANGTFTSTLQISTQGVSGVQASLWKGQGTIAMALAFPGALLLLGFSGKRRRIRGLQMLGVALLLTGGGMGLSGCSQRYGYLHHPPLTATGTPAGTYSISVAVDGSQGASAIENVIPISLVVSN